MRISDWSSDVCSSDLRSFLTGVPGGAAGATLVVMATMFLLGFFLDFVEIVFVVVPVVAPALLAMGVDPVWLGIMMAMNLQTSFLTPPFRFALFYLRGVAPESVRTAAIYRGIIRSEEHTSELQSLMRNSYAVFCMKKKKHKKQQ